MTRPARRATRFLAALGVAAIAVALGLVTAAPAYASTFVAFDATTLADAITSANGSPGVDTILIQPAVGNTITMIGSNPQVNGPIIVTGDPVNPPTIVGPPAAAPIFQVIDPTADIEVDNVKLQGQVGGGSGLTFVSSSGTVTLTGDTFSNFPHQALEFLLQTGPLNITNSTFTGNQSLTADADGGALSGGSFGDVTITGSTFSNNTAGHHGGALFLGDANSVDISNTTFTGNSATDDGGAVEVTSLAADSTWQGNTFTGNTAGSTNGPGGAAFDVGTVGSGVTFLIDGSSFTGNTAAAHIPASAGAVGYVANVLGTFQVLDSTMSGNGFTGLGPDGIGSGIDLAVINVATDAEFDLGQSTLDESDSGSDLVVVQNNNGLVRMGLDTMTGPGILIVSSNLNPAADAVQVLDSIAVSTSALEAIDVGDTPAEIAYSITSSAANPQLVDLGGTQFGVTDPQLGPLANNGGPTRTRLPLAGSPAIDAGDPAFGGSPTTDQRGTGFARVINGRLDIGAVETSVPTLAATGLDSAPTFWAASTGAATGALLLASALLLRRRNTAKQATARR